MMGRIVELFEDSANRGVIQAGKNMYAFLLQSPAESFESIEYDDKVAWAKDYLVARNAFDEALSQLDSEWVYVGTETGVGFAPRDTSTTHYRNINQHVRQSSDNPDIYEVYCSYEIYENKSDSEHVDYEYAHMP